MNENSSFNHEEMSRFHRQYFERSIFGNFHFGHRAQRGDLEPIILSLLKEKAMHGYEIIRTLEERSHGFWRPSAGSVYPILQLLEEKELVVSQEESGKKVYSLTAKGHQQAEETKGHKAHEKHPWEHHSDFGFRFHALRDLIKDCAIAIKDIAKYGTDEDMKAVKTILIQTRDALHQRVTHAHKSDQQN